MLRAGHRVDPVCPKTTTHGSASSRPTDGPKADGDLPGNLPAMTQRILVAAVTGLILTLSFEPVGFAWFAPLGVAGYIWVSRGRRSWLPGLIFGIAFSYVHISWMAASVGVAAWAALAGGLAIFHALFAVVMGRVQTLPLWPLWAAATWVSLELVRGSWPFSGMPWGRVAFATVDTPTSSMVAYLGVTGTGFLIALFSALLVGVVQRPTVIGGAGRPTANKANAIGLLGVVASFVAAAAWPWTNPVSGQVQVAVVQGNVPGDGTNLGDYAVEVTQNHSRATIQLAEDVAAGRAVQPDFVLWPENSTVADPLTDTDTRAAVEAAARAIGVPIVVGAMVKQGDDVLLNQGVVWDPETGPGDRYTKHHPVPFGEYIPRLEPLHGWFSQANFGGLDQIGRDMAGGSRNTPLTVAGVELADAICFDIAYDDVIVPQVANGANLAAVQTSNAIFIKTHQVDQQFEITRVRAVESGRTLLVAATNGVTGIIGADGSVQAQVPIRTTAVINETVDLRDGLTPAVAMGRWPGVVMLALTVTTMVVTLLRGRPSPSTGTAMTEPGAPPEEEKDNRNA